MSNIDLTSQIHESAERCLKRCDELAGFSSMEKGVCRIYLSEEHKACNAQVEKWMRDAGMQSWQDEAGNCWGRFATADKEAPSIILGSHLDTVKNAGKYDGILGVLAALEVVQLFRAHEVTLPFHLDICGFADEEGVRYGATLIGSSAVAGKWQDHWLDLKDADGEDMRSALSAFHGRTLDPEKASRANDDVLAYLELHIEQGPVLEQSDLPVGAVSAIAGARRFTLSVTGMAGHAGTVPMALRSDALVTASKIILRINELAVEHGVVATVGKISVTPDAVNVIPGRCEFSLDIRSGSDEARDAAVDAILAAAQQITDHGACRFEHHQFHSASAVKCDTEITGHIEAAIVSQGLELKTLLSGAGHDAMVFEGVAPIGMIFVRCKGGISHHPAESVQLDDVARGIEVFYDTVLRLRSEL